MKLRPILFSTPMVQALLDGRKTQTRRVVKHDVRFLVHGKPFAKTGEIPPQRGLPMQDVSELIECPYGKVGDVLWVRETWQVRDSRKPNEYEYKASDHMTCAPWKPSIHMPFEAARIFLEITDTRVERLLDISEQDAINEGIERKEHLGLASCTWYRNYMYKDICFPFTYPTHSFQSLWQSINGTDSLDANPWVWVVEFKRINKPTP